MDLESSYGKTSVNNKEESVEDLIKKLQSRGTKIKVIKDGEEENQTPKQTMTKRSESQVNVLSGD